MTTWYKFDNVDKQSIISLTHKIRVQHQREKKPWKLKQQSHICLQTTLIYAKNKEAFTISPESLVAVYPDFS